MHFQESSNIAQRARKWIHAQQSQLITAIIALRTYPRLTLRFQKLKYWVILPFLSHGDNIKADVDGIGRIHYRIGHEYRRLLAVHHPEKRKLRSCHALAPHVFFRFWASGVLMSAVHHELMLMLVFLDLVQAFSDGIVRSADVPQLRLWLEWLLSFTSSRTSS